MKNLPIVVIGGGAAGIMAAGRAASLGKNVVLLEKMGRTGRKIGISGKGRCNLSNNAPVAEFITHFGKNGRFLRQAFHHFFTPQLLTFFAELGLDCVTERGGRIFPESGKALDVVRVLERWLKKTGVDVVTEAAVSHIHLQGGCVQSVTWNNQQQPCSCAILATGGKSYPRTGSTGDGYRLAAGLGHRITPLRPALVPLTVEAPWIAALEGLNLRNIVARLQVDGKRLWQEQGELTFTGDGVGGPLGLQVSMAAGEALEQGRTVEVILDLKPALDEKKLDARLIRDLQSRGGEAPSSILRGLLPKPLVDLCLRQCEIPESKDCRSFPAIHRKRLVHWMKGLRLPISGLKSWDEAIITWGGVALEEVDPATMESKLVPGLFLAGELLDLQADTGGYNLQAAFSTGWLAGTKAY